MDNRNFNIPDEWMIGNIQLLLFLKMELIKENLSVINYCFVPMEDGLQNKSLTTYLIGDKKEVGSKSIDSNLLLTPTGVFYNLDEFLLNGINFIDNNINVSIDYIWNEDQDGSPFKIIPVFIIPLNNTILKCKKMVTSFNSKKKDFSTGLISKHRTINIPSVNIDFEGSMNR